MSAMHPEIAPVMDTNPALRSVLQELVRREPIFHRPELGTTRADYEQMMATDFWEVGASGRRYSRDYVLAELERRRQHPAAEIWEASGFYCRALAPDVYLLTYTLVQDKVRTTRRSTIWQHAPEGWKIVFHQGTIVEEP